MHPIIDHIYETQKVVGQSGKVRPLRGAVDRQEGEFLSQIIKNDPTICRTLEVGCACGLSSLHICLALRGRPGAAHTIVDPNQTGKWDGVGIKHLDAAGFDFCHLIERKSEFALPRLLEDNEGRFDFIFIDGWHTFDHTVVDCFYANRLLKVGGYLVIDDVSFPSVKRVVEFIKNYPCYVEHGAVGRVREKTWKKTARRRIMSLISPRTWAHVLHPTRYRKIFNERVERMVALKKVRPDDRRWDWHDDRF